ncbi:MAG: cupin domain-containing protein [Acidobacteriota bacterium]|nr:cupin domain-containing protein [Acidobacteriota bacterium]
MKKISLNEVLEQPVSHNPEIAKRVFLAAGAIPGLTNLSQAVVKAGQKADRHTHQDMYEVFVVRHGSGVIEVDDERHPLQCDDCVVIEPGESHEISNPNQEDLVLLYFGLLQ